MQRLVLAVLLVAALAAVVSVLWAGLRATLGGPTAPAEQGSDTMQKIAFALLMALIAYVAFAGGG